MRLREGGQEGDVMPKRSGETYLNCNIGLTWISFGFVCNYGQAENVQDDGTMQILLVGIVFA